MRTDYTHITLVVDRSGSMADIATDAQGGINKLVADQKKEPGYATLLLTEFDDIIGIAYGPADLAGFGSYTLVPRNSTALYDAIGKAIRRTGEYLASKDEANRPAKVVFAIVTDGFENASKEWTHDKVRALIDEHTSRWNWQFVFIGANIDAYAVGTSIGIYNTTGYVAVAASAAAVMDSLSHTVSTYRGGGAAATMDSMPDEIDADGNVVESK